jgi:redox-sensitive bicupin YhaK (pirin superfamily)
MKNDPIIRIKPLGFQWETNNPFLFCVHHKDAYPRGNDLMGPEASLVGRSIGYDFVLKDGWRMYHGTSIPGFPVHPHRGFETITIVLEGLVDHADSLGAAGRYGHGDVQWMTAGAGIQHTEMFPLLNTAKENPLELFQIWLNLPSASKFVDPHYKMLWREDIPIMTFGNDAKGRTDVSIIAGKIGEINAPAPPPDSWAADEKNDVAIWILRMEANTSWEIPPAKKEVSRSLYFYKGSSIFLDGQKVDAHQAIDLKTDSTVILDNVAQESHILLLQGRPIDESVVQYGPFVMNTQAEIQQAIHDYQKTQFGGWPWPRPDQVHERTKGRFARYANGEEVRR